MKRAGLIGVAIALLMALAGCGGGDQASSLDFFAMDTYMEVTVYGEDSQELAEMARDEIERLDELLSVTGEGDIGKVNSQGGGEVTGETAELINQALEISRRTEGAFDVTMYPVTQAWGFVSGDYRVPDDRELEELLTLTGWEKVSIRGTQVRFDVAGMGIDLGAIGKGYAGQQVHDLLREAGAESALLELGGNVCLLGSKPDGSHWRVAVRDPEGQGYAGVLSLSDVSVVTSGGYERFFEESGKTYHHIIDPDTGRPADSGLKSVTIISQDGALADALSTAVFVMGEEEAVSFWKSTGDFEMVLITEDGRLVITPGIEDVFEPSENYDLEVIADEDIS